MAKYDRKPSAVRSLRDEKRPTTAKYADDTEQYLAAIAIIAVRSRCGVYISPPSATSGVKVRIYGPEENLDTYCAYDESAGEQYGMLISEALSDTHEATLHQLAAAIAAVLDSKARKARNPGRTSGIQDSAPPEGS